MPTTSTIPSAAVPRPGTIRRWRQYLADERAEAAVYRDLASRRVGEERDILLGLAEAEGQHEAHWLDLLGDDTGKPRRSGFRTRFLGVLARRFGSVFVLALAQRAEGRSPFYGPRHLSKSARACTGVGTGSAASILSRCMSIVAATTPWLSLPRVCVG